MEHSFSTIAKFQCNNNQTHFNLEIDIGDASSEPEGIACSYECELQGCA